MKFVWDEPKRLANIDKHGLDFAALTLEFFIAATIRPVRGGRLQAIGFLGGGMVSVVFVTLGSEGLSVISMRRASRREREFIR